VIETSEKSNDDSLDMGSKTQKEGGLPSTINHSSIEHSHISSINKDKAQEVKSVALKSAFSTEERPENQKFDIKVMDGKQEIHTIDQNACKSVKSL
tara:strand:+ start:436 stop:723 length:288 start_codon:yes stop_codon:yes gene_type:complete